MQTLSLDRLFTQKHIRGASTTSPLKDNAISFAQDYAKSTNVDYAKIQANEDVRFNKKEVTYEKDATQTKQQTTSSNNNQFEGKKDSNTQVNDGLATNNPNQNEFTANTKSINVPLALVSSDVSLTSIAADHLTFTELATKKETPENLTLSELTRLADSGIDTTKFDLPPNSEIISIDNTNGSELNLTTLSITPENLTIHPIETQADFTIIDPGKISLTGETAGKLENNNFNNLNKQDPVNFSELKPLEQGLNEAMLPTAIVKPTDIAKQPTDIAKQPTQIAKPAELGNESTKIDISSMEIIRKPVELILSDSSADDSALNLSENSGEIAVNSATKNEVEGASFTNAVKEYVNKKLGTNQKEESNDLKIETGFKTLGAEQIRFKIDHLTVKDANRVTVTLHPAELGSVDFKLEVPNGGSNAKLIITADTKDALVALKENIHQLEEQLRNIGIETGGSPEFNLKEGNKDNRQQREFISYSRDDNANNENTLQAAVNSYRKMADVSIDAYDLVHANKTVNVFA